MATRTNQDALLYTPYGASQTVLLYSTTVRRIKKNTLISYVEPLLSGDNIKSSMYNLNSIKTVFSVKAWVTHASIDPLGFADAQTIDLCMAQTTICKLRWRDKLLEGYVVSYTIIENPGEYAGDYTQVEFLFEVGKAI